MGATRAKAIELLNRVVPPGVVIRSIDDRPGKQPFFDLTGKSHQDLLTNWKGGGIETACNGFVGWYAVTLQRALSSSANIGGITSWFKLKESLRKMGRLDAWVDADGTVDPQPGDILHHTQKGTGLHVDVCLGFNDERHLMRVGAGQTSFAPKRNPNAETDILTRVTGTGVYDFHKLIGWLDIEKFFEIEAVGDVTKVEGWWDVNDGSQYYYYFARDGRVLYTDTAPKTMFGPPRGGANFGHYTVRPMNVVFIRWNPLDGGATEETFTGDGRWSSMTGKSNKYGPLLAKRL
jgi:hypothetical protein